MHLPASHSLIFLNFFQTPYFHSLLKNEGERQALHSLAQEEFLDDGSSLIPRDRGDASHVSKGNLKLVFLF